MYDRILIATDGSELAQKGVDHGIALAKDLGAAVLVVMATEPYPLVTNAAAGWAPLPQDIESYENGQKKNAEDILNRVVEQARQSGVQASTLHADRIRPAEAIIEAAKAKECNLIVMASHGRRGLGRLLLGSQTSEVLSHSSIPVLVVR